jgi:REP element-mobilizing transposase RayT
MFTSMETSVLLSYPWAYNEEGPKRWHISDQYAAYFMTFTAVGWVDIFTRKQCAQIILDSFTYCQENKGLILYAYVIMSSHLHLIAAAQDGSAGLSAIVRDFKTFTSKKLIAWMKDNPKESRRYWLDVVFKYHAKYNSRNNGYQVWQQYNKPMKCVTPKFTLQKLNYIHRNPVSSGIVDRPEDYKYSSARNYTGRTDGLIPVKIIDFGPTIGYIPGAF